MLEIVGVHCVGKVKLKILVKIINQKVRNNRKELPKLEELFIWEELMVV
jgi:hypothetical protein